MVNFIYLAHSQERFLRQTLFSALSLMEYLSQGNLECRIIVYTDNPDFFKPLGLETMPIDAARIRSWTEKIDYIHRAKICLMIDAAKHFEGKLMTLDSDNCFYSEPTDFLNSWADDTVVMEKFEYHLKKPADRVGRKYKRFFQSCHSLGDPFCNYEVTMNQECWNSGVLGVPETARQYLPHALAVCDDLHTIFNKHISEQLATSIVMSKRFKIVAFKQFTFHWFGHGQAINRIIERALGNYPEGNLAEWSNTVSDIRDEVLNAPLNCDKQGWYKRWLIPKT
jgi:hypothetical protein